MWGIAQKMHYAHDQQSTMVLGQHFVFYHVPVPGVARIQVRVHIAHVFDSVPVNGGISAKDADLGFATPAYIRLADCPVKLRDQRRLGANQANSIAPCLLNVLQENSLPPDITIDRLLIE